MFIEDEELRTIFSISNAEHLQKIEEKTLLLEKYPQDENILAELMRIAHSLKGDANMLGIKEIGSLAHQIEHIFGQIKRQETTFTTGLCDRILSGLEVIRQLAHEAVTGTPANINTFYALAHLMGSEVSPPTTPIKIKSPTETKPQNLAEITPFYEPEKNQEIIALDFLEDEELRTNFEIGTEKHLAFLEESLPALKTKPQAQLLEEILQSVHALKGDSGMLGLLNIHHITHQLETILNHLKKNLNYADENIWNELIKNYDILKQLIKQAVTNNPDSDPNNALAIPQEKSQKPTDNYRIDTIRVETHNLDALMTLTGELTVTKIRIAHRLNDLEKLVTFWENWSREIFMNRFTLNYLEIQNHSSLNYVNNLHKNYEQNLDQIGSLIANIKSTFTEDYFRLDLISTELDSGIYTLRLLPLATIFNLFPRLVRDLARQQNKQIDLVLQGGETKADKRILEEMKDPIIHMLRNAIDHGIETPTERIKAGKSPTATIWLRGYQQGNHIILEIADDGRGLNLESIKQTAIKRGICQAEELLVMTENQIYALIFTPGFSTRNFVTEVSGRGIGLDVTKTNIDRLKGIIEVESLPQKGCTFRLHISTTLSTAHVLLVTVKQVSYGIPVEFIHKAFLLAPRDIFTLEEKSTIVLDKQPVSVAFLEDLLELNDTLTQEREEKSWFYCVVIKVGEEYLGLIVDGVVDKQDVVLKNQSKLLKRIRNISGATILGTGEVCMVLNPHDLIKSVKANKVHRSLRQKTEKPRKQVILLVEDSLATRTQEKRILETAGYEVVTAVDGLDGFNKLQTGTFDAVVSDIQMPNLDGLGLTAKIRQYPQYSELPIILVTSLACDEDKQRGAEAGASAYITKNVFNQQVLLETLQRLI